MGISSGREISEGSRALSVILESKAGNLTTSGRIQSGVVLLESGG